MGHSAYNLKNKHFWGASFCYSHSSMRFRTSLLAFLCFALVSIVWLPHQSFAVDQDAAFQQALGSQDPLYKFSPAALTVAVKLCSSRDPSHAGSYVALVLHSGRTDAAAIAPALVKAAIQGLGVDPRPALVGNIVRASVTAAPSEVLPIVSAAIKASPRSAAPAIVTAAVKSVPHPEKTVTVTLPPVAGRAYGDDKQIDGKEVEDKQLAASQGKTLTLAEAIVQTALAADPSLSADALAAAADEGFASNLSPNPPAPPGILTTVLNPVIPILPTGPGPVSP